MRAEPSITPPAPARTPAAVPAPSPPADFAGAVARRFERLYRGPSGLFGTEADIHGHLTDSTPVLADFGDIQPFLWAIGKRNEALEQIHLADPFLVGGLVARGNQIFAADNHDWLLGLVELARLSGSTGLVNQAAAAGRELHRRLFRDGLAARSVPLGEDRPRNGPPGLLVRTSPLGASYIELFVDLHVLTGDSWFLDEARRQARAWRTSPFFRRYGLFRRFEVIGFPLASAAGSRLSREPLVRLFKDNTNLIHSILALHRVAPEPLLEEMLGQWMEGFAAHFLNDGAVGLHLDRRLRCDAPSLKAAFSAIEVLCDGHTCFPERAVWLERASRIAAWWLARQWPCGLFPLTPGAPADHLDANVDMVVALLKLAERTGNDAFSQSAWTCARAVLDLHQRTGGYVLSVDTDGRVVDGRVFVKYQGLVLKLALLPAPGGSIYADQGLFTLLRDR